MASAGEGVKQDSSAEGEPKRCVFFFSEIQGFPYCLNCSVPGQSSLRVEFLGAGLIIGMTIRGGVLRWRNRKCVIPQQQEG